MPKRMLDYKTRAPDGYFEDSVIRGVEMDIVTDKDCLIQAFIGELKTNKGECYGIGQQDYGSDLKRIIGDVGSVLMEIEIEDAIQAVAQKYYEIWTSKVNAIAEEGEDVFIRIELETVYGIELVELNLQRGC